MPSTPVNFTTGPSLLPDVGVLSYNGCTFSPLFETKVTGTPLGDEAGRTVKYTKLTISVDGYVTLSTKAASISPTMVTLHQLLTAQGGALRYVGRGFDIAVNTGPIANHDLAWGPVPELIEFQPLGGGLSAKVRWNVTVHLSGQAAGRGFPASLNQRAFNQNVNLLQFNFDSSVTYNEDYFSTLSLHGTLEIPLTRVPGQSTRTLTFTADDLRHVVNDLALRGIDLSRFRVTRRDFTLSRDKRTITWDVTAEEKPYMDLPPNCTIARGTYTVKPARTGPGLCLWLCSLSASYTVRADRPRRQAYQLFLALLRLRMAESERGNIPRPQAPQGVGAGPGAAGLAAGISPLFGVIALLGSRGATGPIATINPTVNVQAVQDLRRAILIDFSINEGLYLDSKSVTFSATWRLCTTFSHILVASGLWTKIRERDAAGANLWATTVRDISGENSWLRNRADPAFAAIVDFGS